MWLNTSSNQLYATQAEAIAAGDGEVLEFTSDEANDFQREWRNQELEDTDWIVSITDHSERAAYITYREALRDWPSTDDFPNTRPTRE